MPIDLDALPHDDPDNERALVLLQPVKKEFIPFPGSTEIRADCEHLCWISPALKRDVDQAQMPKDIVCLDCAFKNDKLVMAMMERGTSMTPESMAELKAEIGEERFNRLVKEKNIKEQNL